jgi:phosphatidylglycerophosphatase A
MITLPLANSKKKSQRRITPAQVFGNPYCFLAFGFGSGLAPVAPGTFGTLAAIPLYWLLANLSFPLYAAIVIGLALAGIRICRRCEEILEVSDHSGIVWDEIVGFLIAMAAVPATWTAVLLGFLAFRVFDILKPWPIAHFDRTVHGGVGVMLDDVLAGLYAAVLMFLLT